MLQQQKSTKSSSSKTIRGTSQQRQAPDKYEQVFKRFKDMAALDQAVECLRVLVKNDVWDYCIVWKLGDDPSRLKVKLMQFILQFLLRFSRNSSCPLNFFSVLLEKKPSCLQICGSFIDYSFIEWRGCCCSGGNWLENVKEESGKDPYLFAQCRDGHAKHPIRTKACEKLAKFPLSIPLYSGYCLQK